MATFYLFCLVMIATDTLVFGITTIFNNSNNMGYFINSDDIFNCITAPGYSANGLISLGSMDSLQECIALFESNTTNYRSFIYFESDVQLINNQNFSTYCYVRTDTWFNPVSQMNVISGQIDNFYECRSDKECEYNGKCMDNKCKCKAAWKGNFCETLNFKKGAKNLGYQRVNYSQWGGDVIYDNKSKKWIMFATEMYDKCGINSCCCTNSQIVKAISDNGAGGPYIYDSIVINYFAHEPMLAVNAVNNDKRTDKLYLLFHWGNGVSSDINNNSLPTTCINGYSDGLPPNYNRIESEVTYNYISYFSDLNDNDLNKWKMMKIPGDYIDSDLCPSNAYIFENGSVLMTYVERDGFEIGSVMKLITSNSWNTTYTLHKNKLFDINTFYDCSSMEDPFLWFDKIDQTFHLLMHGMIYVDNPGGVPWLKKAIGRHAYSTNGINWILSPHYAYGSTICYDNNQCITYGRRERPHLIFDPDTNEPIYLTNGIQINNLVQYDKTFLSAVPLYTSNDFN